MIIAIANRSLQHFLVGGLLMLAMLASIAPSPAAKETVQPPPAPPHQRLPEASAGQPGPPVPSSPVRDPGAKTAGSAGTAIIRGRVVSLDTATPLRRAEIRVTSQQMRMRRVVLTDAHGRYEIKGLPAGRFELTALKGGYVVLNYGQRRPLEPGRPIELADGQTVEKIDFSLPRGGVIAGRVVDELGEPVTNTNVSALSFRRIGGRRRLMSTSNTRGALTNDIGQFRIFGLPPGDYYVATSGQPEIFATAENGQEASTGYVTTYYPGTPSLAEAQRVMVNVGEELNVDIQLVPTRVFRISGTAADSTGRLITSGTVMLQSRDELPAPGDASGTVIKPDGSFVLSNVPSGSYYLAVHTMMAGGSRERESASMPIIVGGQDIENVRVVTSRGGIIQGRVTYEGADPAVAQTPLDCLPTDPDTPFLIAGASAVAEAQQQFEMKGVHGPCVIRVVRPAPGWIMKSVLHEGQDITDRPVVPSSGKAFLGVEVVLTTRQTMLSGTVTDKEGRPLTEFAVVAFPDEKEKWGYRTRYVRTSRADQDGRFKLTGLPPGEYLVLAVETLEQGGELDPEFLDSMRPMSVRVRLVENDTQSVTLKIASSNNP